MSTIDTVGIVCINRNRKSGKTMQGKNSKFPKTCWMWFCWRHWFDAYRGRVAPVRASRVFVFVLLAAVASPFFEDDAVAGFIVLDDGVDCRNRRKPLSEPARNAKRPAADLSGPGVNWFGVSLRRKETSSPSRT